MESIVRIFCSTVKIIFLPIFCTSWFSKISQFNFSNLKIHFEQKLNYELTIFSFNFNFAASFWCHQGVCRCCWQITENIIDYSTNFWRWKIKLLFAILRNEVFPPTNYKRMQDFLVERLWWKETTEDSRSHLRILGDLTHENSDKFKRNSDVIVLWVLCNSAWVLRWFLHRFLMWYWMRPSDKDVSSQKQVLGVF